MHLEPFVILVLSVMGLFMLVLGGVALFARGASPPRKR